jgi:DNA polymerase-1
VRATEEGYVRTVFGRRRAVPELRAANQRDRSLGERLAVNTVLQGSAADIIKVAMIRAAKELAGRRLAARLVLQIHDELIFEAPKDEVEQVIDLVRTAMCGAYEMDPPLEVSVGVGENWLAAK